MKSLTSLVLVSCVCLAGCTGGFATTTPTATPESPPELTIHAEGDWRVQVEISYRGNESTLLNKTYDLEPGETITFDQILDRPKYYHVHISVENNDEWERTVVPSESYSVEIKPDGTIQVAM